MLTECCSAANLALRSQLRSPKNRKCADNLHPYNVEHLRMAQAMFPWITEDYDKIPVERTVLGDSGAAGNSASPADGLWPRRSGAPFFSGAKADRRQPPGNPAGGKLRALASTARLCGRRCGWNRLAAVSEQSAGKIYNIASDQQFTELEWAQRIGQAGRLEGLGDGAAQGDQPRAT